jgi:hypothetical protein
MDQKTYLRIAGAFFLADVIFHAIRLAVWLGAGEMMEFPLWISPIAIIFSGFFAWQGLRLGMRQ